MPITAEYFPVPCKWDDLEVGTLVTRVDSHGRALGMVVNFDDSRCFLVLAHLDGKSAQGDFPPPYVENQFGSPSRIDGKVVARPVTGVGTRDASEPSNGALTVGGDGLAAIRAHADGDVTYFGLATGEEAKIPSPRTYYRDWQLVLVNGTKERVLLTMLPGEAAKS